MNLNDLKYKRFLLPGLAVAAGLVGLLLRLWLYGTGLEENNLLRASHPARYLLPVLGLVFGVTALLLTRRERQSMPYGRRFPRSLIAALGSWIFAVGLLLASMTDLVRRDNALNTLTGLLGVLAAAGLIWVGLLRMQGKRPAALPHAAVCLFLVARLISRYQGWSADPQLQDYCYQLLSLVCLMLYSYHRSALDYSDGSGRAVHLTGLLSIYCCLLATVRSDDRWFYLCAAAWVLLSTLPASREEAPEAADALPAETPYAEEVPNEDPDAEPEEVPDEDPDAEPEEVPDEDPDVEPEEVPDEEPDDVPEEEE